jgi:anthranilate phosphoribosyltransferase
MGPLSNPAGARRQLIGVFSRDWLETLAEVLGRLGTERAWIVHGSDGMDEITTTGPTHVAELKDGKVRRFEISPEDVGLRRADPADLKGGDSVTNARALTELLEGAKGAYRDVVLFNAAAALMLAGKAPDLKAGKALAETAIDSGKARAVLAKLVAVTNETVPA